MERQKIVIAGAGFGGVRAARKLAQGGVFDITVIADRDTFRYYPALYATATGHAYEESIIPLSEMLEGLRGVRFVKDSLTKLDSKNKRIQGASGEWYEYDSLILALGVVTNYFGIKGLEEFSFGIKSEQEVTKFKKHIHAGIMNKQKSATNYVVVGAGPTGVEFSAALKTYTRDIADRHKAAGESDTIKLIEAMPRVLPKMPEAASRMVEKRLKKLGVEVMTGAKVEGETADELQVNGAAIQTQTVIWTSGVANNPFFKANATQLKLAPNGKVQVDSFMQGASSVYVIGDNAATPHSGLAQTALYDADFVARNLKRQAHRLEPLAYKPYKPPVVVPVGRWWALVEWGPLMFAGVIGALLRRCADLIGYIDILPFFKAIKIWLRASRREEECPVCVAVSPAPQQHPHDADE
ncbi:MAG TPA: FAD-dependent oxidoreductase [Candidatus Saccharimonadales bacterium]